jgi:hypothetical protein
MREKSTGGLGTDLTVYRGFRSNGCGIRNMYESMIGEVADFASTSLNEKVVIDRFVKSPDGISFEIELPEWSADPDISRYSGYRNESEVPHRQRSSLIHLKTNGSARMGEIR